MIDSLPALVLSGCLLVVCLGGSDCDLDCEGKIGGYREDINVVLFDSKRRSLNRQNESPHDSLSVLIHDWS